MHNAPDPKEFSAKISVDTSTTDHAENPSYGFNGVVNIPLGPQMAFRLSTGYEKSAGFINGVNAVEFGREPAASACQSRQPADQWARVPEP